MADRRRLLEVLRVPPEDNLSHTSFVSRLWLGISGNEEVWASLYFDFAFTPRRHPSFKEGFYQEIAMLPIVSNNSLRIFSCRSQMIVSEVAFKGGIDIRSGIAVAVLPKGGLIVCGGIHSHGDKDDEASRITNSGSIQQRAQRHIHQKRSLCIWRRQEI